MNMKKLIAVAAVAASAMASPSWAATNITEDVVLDANADWRGLRTVTVEAGATLDLRGHNLQVTDIAGTGTITSDYGITPPAAPSIVSESAIFWLDAADESTLAMDESCSVTTWTSKDSSHRVATVRTSSKKPVYRRFAYGRPCVDFGGYNSGVDMTYTQLNNIRTAFFVFKILKPCFFLNDSTHVNFHRNDGGQYGIAKYFKGTVWNGLDAVRRPRERLTWRRTGRRRMASPTTPLPYRRPSTSAARRAEGV